MEKRVDTIVSVLSHGESHSISVTIDVDTMEGLVMSRGVALAAGVVDASGGLEGGDNGFLVQYAHERRAYVP